MREPQKILIFTGAGASVPLGLPASTGFVEDIRSGMRTVTSSVIDYLGDGPSEDIEWILSALESFRSEVSCTEHMLPLLVGGHPHAEAGEPHIKTRLGEFKDDASFELRRIKKLLFDRLNKYEPDQAASLYSSLIAQIRKRYSNASISLITTNYDLTVETSIEHGKNDWKSLGIESFNFGFSNRFGRPIYDPSQDFGWIPSVVEYLKIHGSLDWHPGAQGNCSRSMSVTAPDDPDRMVILYPGFKGVPEKEPFISLHGRLHRRLSEADVVLVIGFAFRDAYVNSMFENTLRLRKDVHMLYFNPLPLDEHPAGSAAPRFAVQYPRFVHHASRFECTDSPLAFPAVPETQIIEQAGSAA